MTVLREFHSNFTKIKRTPLVFLYSLPPFAATPLFLIYYAAGGYHIISDVRMFFVIIQLCQPIFVGIAVPVLIHLDRNIHGIQNALGLVESRNGVYLGKLLFLLYLSSVNVILYELCFYVGVNFYAGINFFPEMDIIHFSSCFVIFIICIFSNLILYLIHIPIAFRYGSGISVLTGISGTILAGYFENAIGDKIWPLIPWEWGVRFLENYLEFSSTPVIPGVISLVIVTSAVLALSLLWFGRWEGNVVQE